MNAQKRVSFGMKGSLVETLIIDDYPELTEADELKQSGYDSNSHDTILKNKVTFCDTPKATGETPKATEQIVDQTITYSEVLILDSPPSGHKPIPRSASLESRDNPFIPGGSLDQEASDILKRATIIRDQFHLSEENNDKDEQISAIERTDDNGDINETCQDSAVTEETILQQSLNNTQVLPEKKQNGKIGEKTLSTDSQPLDNSQKDGTLDRSMKDKKKQKKCCSVM